MPRYFFHIANGADVLSDPTGTILPDADHALTTADGIIRDMHDDVAGEPPCTFDGWHLHICRDDGSVVETRPLKPHA